MKVNGHDIPDQAIAEVCRRRHIRRLALFGSVLRGALRPDSDIDVLVEFEEEHVPGFAFFDIQEELADLLGRKVDLNTPQFLAPCVQAKIQADARVVFVSP